MSILAYHLVWTTYGTWLSGDDRGWIKKSRVGVQPPNGWLEERHRLRMAADAIYLSQAQRELVEQTIREHCRIRGWDSHAINIRSNHAHVVVTAKDDSDKILSQFKAWCSRRLSDDAGFEDIVARKAGRCRWFTEGGDRQLIECEEYLENAIRYVIEGQ
jgi:REP element-mobilizing transposase RayT